MTKRRERSHTPQSFSLAGMTWTVAMVDDLEDLGECDAELNLIKIRGGMSQQQTDATFFHELTHAIEYTMGITDPDEQRVEAFGQLLYQFSKTKKM